MARNSAHKSPQMDIDTFLSDCVYYPCAGTDGTPVKYLARLGFTNYLYADYHVSPDALCGQLDGRPFTGYDGYGFSRVSNEELFGLPTDAVHMLYQQTRGHLRLDWEYPFATLVQLRRKPGYGEEHGPQTISLMYAQFEAVTLFKHVFASRGIAPKCLVCIRAGIGFGGTYSGYPSALTNAAKENPGGLPRFILYDRMSGDPKMGDYITLVEDYFVVKTWEYETKYSGTSKITLAAIDNELTSKEEKVILKALRIRYEDTPKEQAGVGDGNLRESKGEEDDMRIDRRPKRIAAFCADVGKIPKGFGWAGLKDVGDSDSEDKGNDISTLVTQVAQQLKEGQKVALGFECPMYVPCGREPTELLQARADEHMAFVGGAGATTLAVGLCEYTYVLRELRKVVGPKVKAYQDWGDFTKAHSGLFLWEAFVTGKAKGKTDIEDAQIALEEFCRRLPNPHSDLGDEPAFSLIGAALLRTGWTDDVSVLEERCLVIRPSAPHEAAEERAPDPDPVGSDDSFTCLCCKYGIPKERPRICPICKKVFRGNGWDGIDAHWRSKHEEDDGPYEDFWNGLCDDHRD